jgi:hypothetical protein
MLNAAVPRSTKVESNASVAPLFVIFAIYVIRSPIDALVAVSVVKTGVV